MIGRLAVMVACAWFLPTAHAACDPDGRALLNELMPNPGAEVNPDGNSDGDYEWVELYNPGPDPVSLEGWRVEAASRVSEGLDNPGDYQVLFEVPADVVLEAGAWLVIGGPAVVLEDDVDLINLPLGRDRAVSMGNATSNSDAVRLVACDNSVRDVVAYGSNTDDGQFLDEELEAIITEKLAPKPTDDRSLARVPDGTDTNNPVQDFVRSFPSTPGRSNGDTGASAACNGVAPAGAVVINELMPNPGAAVNPEGNSDDGYEWLEVYNTTDGALDLGGWTIEQASTPAHWGTRTRFTFPGGAVLAPGAFFVVAESLAVLPEGIAVYRLEEGVDLAMGNSQDAVRLVGCAAAVIDEVIYGGSNPDGFLDGEGGVLPAEAIAPVVKDDEALARRADGYDTDNSGEDFAPTSIATPGAPNPDLRCKTTAGGIVINEFLANPSGADSDALSEWVELYNLTDGPLDVSTWVITRVSGVDEEDNTLVESVLTSLPPGTIIEAGGYYVVGAIFAEEAQHFVEPFDLYSGSAGDAVLLYDCEGRRADGVVYGGENEDRIPEDSGLVPDLGVRKPSDDQCVARPQDGADTNNSLEDFVTTSFCTPGATNVRSSGTDTGGGTLPPRGCGGAGPRQVNPISADPDGGCQTAPVGGSGGLVLLTGLVMVGRRRTRAGIA